MPVRMATSTEWPHFPQTDESAYPENPRKTHILFLLLSVLMFSPVIDFLCGQLLTPKTFNNLLERKFPPYHYSNYFKPCFAHSTRTLAIIMEPVSYDSRNSAMLITFQKHNVCPPQKTFLPPLHLPQWVHIPLVPSRTGSPAFSSGMSSMAHLGKEVIDCITSSGALRN